MRPPQWPRKRQTKQSPKNPERFNTNRNVVEHLWVRLKELRALATRYEKTASSFKSILCLAAALDRFKR
ncbi:transposase [Microvirga massiliensis]|uniref:transposase n=1 Tax=Microvirga massiliensis TaxID=1033741 RepID=UPI00062BB141